MLRFLLVFLFTIPAFANVILVKHQVSGYVMPEHSFVKDCQIHSNGHVESVVKNGDGTTNSFSRHISFLDVKTIKVLNHLANRGKIEDQGVLCDAGTTVITGYLGTHEVVIESSYDCQARLVNKSTAANLLMSMAKDICAF